MSVYETITSYVNRNIDELKKTNKLKYVFEDTDDGGPQLTQQPMYLSDDGSGINSRFHKVCPSCNRYVRNDQYNRTASEIKEARIKKKPCNECQAIPDAAERKRLERIRQGGTVPLPVEESAASKVMATVEEIEAREKREEQLLADAERRRKAEEYSQRQREEAARIQREEAARIQREEAARIQREEAARIQREEAARIQREKAVLPTFPEERVSGNVRPPNTDSQVKPRMGAARPTERPKESYTTMPVNEPLRAPIPPKPPLPEELPVRGVGWSEIPTNAISNLVKNLYDEPYDPEIDHVPDIGDGWFEADGLLSVVESFDPNGEINVVQYEIGKPESNEEEPEYIEEELEYIEGGSAQMTPEELKRFHRVTVWSTQPIYLLLLVLPSVMAWWNGSAENIYIYRGVPMFVATLAAWVHCMNCTREGAFNSEGEPHSDIGRVLFLGLSVQVLLYAVFSVHEALTM